MTFYIPATRVILDTGHVSDRTAIVALINRSNIDEVGDGIKCITSNIRVNVDAKAFSVTNRKVLLLVLKLKMLSQSLIQGFAQSSSSGVIVHAFWMQER